MAIVTKTHASTCQGTLFEDINADVAIGVALYQIIDDQSGDLDFDFAAALTAPQEAALDALLAGHTCPVIEPDFNVQLTPPNEGDVVVYRTDKWVNEVPVLDLNFDVDTTTLTPAVGHVLRHDGTEWVNVPAAPIGPSGSFNVIQLFWGPIPAISGTTTIPKDTSLPLIGEGSEIWTETITPTINTSSIRIATNVTFSSSNASIELVFAVYRDNVCIGTAVNTTANKSSGFAVSYEIYDTPATASEIVYSCRVGKTGGGGTWYINDIHSDIGAFAGTLAQNSYSVEEIGAIP